MRRAQTERGFTCDSLLEVGPGAPTLCEGWTAHDLAAHLWLRENEPVSSLGFFVPSLEARTRARMRQLQRQLQFTELVEVLRDGPPKLSLFNLPGADEAGNAVEFLIHGLDVRRANDLPEPGRDAGFQAWAWQNLTKAAPLMLRKTQVGLVLEWVDRPGHVVRAAKGNRIVTVIGQPSELLLYAFGRSADADVELVGLPDAVASVR